MTIEPGSFPAPSHYPGPYSWSSELPLGEWNLMANGRIWQLELTDVAQGKVEGHLSSGDFVNGEWNGSAGPNELAVLTFVRVTSIKQIFTGRLMHYSDRDPLWRMAGTMEQPDGSGTGVWYATLPRR